MPRTPTPWAFAVVAILAACAGRGREMPPVEQEPAAETIIAAAIPEPERLPQGAAVRTVGRCDAAQDTVHFIVAHINDLQARYGDLVAGHSRYAYIAGYLSQLKRENSNTLVLDAGDDYEKGSIAELRSMGETTRQMVQALPIDVRTIGNHDFAYGAAALERDVTSSAHPVLAANVHRVGASDTAPFLPFVRVDVGCVRVGIAGLVASNYGSNDYPTREPFDGVFQQDDRYAQVLTEVVRAHRAEVDVMIALDHIGFWTDVDLAGRVEGVDLFVGGHSEDLVTSPYGVARRDGSRAWVVQAGHWARTFGRADLAYSRRDHTLTIERYSIVKVDESLPVDEEVDALARRLQDEGAPGARDSIAVVGTPVAQGKPMDDLVWRAVQDRWGADAMLLGKDQFWDGLPRGPVTLQRLYDTVYVQREPAGTSGFSSLYVVSVSGAELAQLRARLIVGPLFAFYAPDVLDPAREYRLVIEKRALENPQIALYAARRGAPRTGLEQPRGRWGGELIDVLQGYARSRTMRGLTLD
jgi:5'-nucleotidase/UDP-sugar diphosphatase